jgi:hypothetical protein
MHIVIDPPRTKKDFSVRGGATIGQVTLAPQVQQVKTGTPICPSAEGWVVARRPGEAVAFSAEHRFGGEATHAYIFMVVDAGKDLYDAGSRYAITDIDEYGNLTLEKDEAGPHPATSKSAVLLNGLDRGVGGAFLLSPTTPGPSIKE